MECSKSKLSIPNLNVVYSATDPPAGSIVGIAQRLGSFIAYADAFAFYVTTGPYRIHGSIAKDVQAETPITPERGAGGLRKKQESR